MSDTEDDQTREFVKTLFDQTDDDDNETGTPEPEPTDDDHKAVRLFFDSKD